MAEIGVFCWYLLITDQQLDLNILFPTHCCDCFWGEGVTSIMELCAKGLAINFAEAVLWEGFVDIPFLLLWACVDHPELTVHRYV
jgi:hypothetical protein